MGYSYADVATGKLVESLLSRRDAEEQMRLMFPAPMPLCSKNPQSWPARDRVDGHFGR